MGESMRALLATAAFAASIGAASAADLGGGHIIPALPAVPAVLAPSTSWTGCYAGVAGGWGISKTEVSIPPWASLDGLGADGGILGVLGGCDIQMGALVLGGFANYDWHQDHDVTLTIGTASASTGIAEQWAVGGRAGVLVGPSLVYGLAGYTEAKLDIGDHAGWVYGGGIELPIGNGFSLRGEYTYSDLDSEAYGPVVVDPDVHAVKAALTYKIGVGR
jgi:opacity protein-like surface antigen